MFWGAVTEEAAAATPIMLLMSSQLKKMHVARRIQPAMSQPL